MDFDVLIRMRVRRRRRRAAFAPVSVASNAFRAAGGVSTRERARRRLRALLRLSGLAGWGMFALPLTAAALAFLILGRRKGPVVVIASVIAALAVLNALVIMFLSPE
jgi:hypothetical protein